MKMKMPNPNELWKIADRLESLFLRRNLKRLVARLSEIEKLKSSKVISVTEAKELKKRVNTAVREFAREFEKESKALQELMYERGWKIAARELGIKGTFQGIPRKALETMNQGLVFMRNYSSDLIRIAENEIAVAIMAGDSYENLIARLMGKIGQNGKRNIATMARDQLGRIMQIAAYDSLSENESDIAYYLWNNPNDERTTDWCRNRLYLNPWTVEDVKYCIENNPVEWKGYEIRDPDIGSTFLHPHIQCRSVLTAVTKSAIKEGMTSKEELKGFGLGGKKFK